MLKKGTYKKNCLRALHKRSTLEDSWILTSYNDTNFRQMNINIRQAKKWTKLLN